MWNYFVPEGKIEFLIDSCPAFRDLISAHPVE
jgi:hypothetical protein